MGAVTSLLYASSDQDFAGLIADSPFSNLKVLALEIANSKVFLPNFLLEGFLSLINSSIEERAGFRLEQIDLTKVVGLIDIPAVFVTSTEDKLVNQEHPKKLHSIYKGPAQLKLILGEHNGDRNFLFRRFVADFFQESFEKHSKKKQEFKQSIDNANKLIKESQDEVHKSSQDEILKQISNQTETNAQGTQKKDEININQIQQINKIDDSSPCLSPIASDDCAEGVVGQINTQQFRQERSISTLNQPNNSSGYSIINENIYVSNTTQTYYKGNHRRALHESPDTQINLNPIGKPPVLSHGAQNEHNKSDIITLGTTSLQNNLINHNSYQKTPVPDSSQRNQEKAFLQINTGRLNTQGQQPLYNIQINHGRSQTQGNFGSFKQQENPKQNDQGALYTLQNERTKHLLINQNNAYEGLRVNTNMDGKYYQSNSFRMKIPQVNQATLASKGTQEKISALSETQGNLSSNLGMITPLGNQKILTPQGRLGMFSTGYNQELIGQFGRLQTQRTQSVYNAQVTPGISQNPKLQSGEEAKVVKLELNGLPSTKGKQGVSSNTYTLKNTNLKVNQIQLLSPELQTLFKPNEIKGIQPIQDTQTNITLLKQNTEPNQTKQYTQINNITGITSTIETESNESKTTYRDINRIKNIQPNTSIKTFSDPYTKESPISGEKGQINLDNELNSLNRAKHMTSHSYSTSMTPLVINSSDEGSINPTQRRLRTMHQKSVNYSKFSDEDKGKELRACSDVSRCFEPLESVRQNNMSSIPLRTEFGAFHRIEATRNPSPLMKMEIDQNLAPQKGTPIYRENGSLFPANMINNQLLSKQKIIQMAQTPHSSMKIIMDKSTNNFHFHLLKPPFHPKGLKRKKPLS